MDGELKEAGRLIGGDEALVLDEWLREVASVSPGGGASNPVTQADARNFLRSFLRGVEAGGDISDLTTSASWLPMREFIADLASSRAAQGQPVAETAAFLLAFKKPLFDRSQQAYADDPSKAIRVVWAASRLVDGLARMSTAIYQQTCEEVIRRQQEEILELSTPVVKMWDGVLAVPMIGTLDSSRTQLVMESLLQRLVDTESRIAIIDITGVPTVDTLVAQHLLKTVAALRLMGADCIVSGIRPQIAQTIVHLGIDLQGITTKATLADALKVAIKRAGFTIARSDVH